MNPTAELSWETANRACLTAALAEVRATLAAFITAKRDGSISSASTETPEQNAPEIETAMQPASAIDTLCATFGLTSFERKVLLMCAGLELDARFADLYRAASREFGHALPTFSLALAAFDDAHWSALLPSRPFRYWHLLELMTGDALTTSPLHINERILHYLTGAASMDERLRCLTEAVAPPAVLLPSYRSLAERITAHWPNGNGQLPWPVVQLFGAERSGKRAVAAAVSAGLGFRLRAISAAATPRAAAELDLFIRLWEREAALNPTVLLLEYDELEPPDSAGESAVNRLLETMRSPVLVSVRERCRHLERPFMCFDVPGPTMSEQRQLWREALGDKASLLNETVDALVGQFSLGPQKIDAAAAQALGPGNKPVTANETNGLAAHVSGDKQELSASLWETCRIQAQPELAGLAQRIQPAAEWGDLILPETEKQLLGQIAVHVRHRSKVYQSWGFAAKGARGLGISALFAGPSGTGKTMAGEVLANELRLDLYRIDLSQVISKYIGETEKNLRRVFDAAEEGAAILLFDEADALFGKRSEVKDSHDRYANIEVSYLLQRMELYRGLAILTTNRKEALDPAFLRRIRFVVEFPFPQAAQRAEIWRRVFPRETPTEDLCIERLARLNAAGGHIRNIAIGAAFLAADSGEPVRMSHLLAAARTEFLKIELPLSAVEIAGWV